MATIIIGRTLSSSVDSVRADQGTVGVTPWLTRAMNALVTEPYDYIALGYNGLGLVNLAVYRQGGAGGTIVATINITYVGRLIATVTRV